VRVFPDRQVISQPLNSKQTHFQRTNKQWQMSRHNGPLPMCTWAWTGNISYCKKARRETGWRKEEIVWVRTQKSCTLKADPFLYKCVIY